ncbi:YagK/YfjJ domain-containing protein [Orbus mooreae]|uniref:YagK/YfjJ domain-containing protein n=1 Tax=Orbus mooreae TaxID=3074107 RepID=UPI00370DC740
MSSQNRYTYNLRNQVSIIHFVDALFDKHAKLLPVRVDLGYKTNERITIDNQNSYNDNKFNYLLNPDLPPHAYLSQEVILHNWNELLNRLRWNKREFLKELVGYVWKIEYGNDKGIHYHLVLFFNGNKVQKDYYYAEKLGALWLELTKGLGVYFNCSSDKTRRYGDNNALKVIHRIDDKANLYQMMNYLTKVDDNEDIARALSGGRLLGKSY